jgi:5'(3')-deoxyribonucleotidase
MMNTPRKPRVGVDVDGVLADLLAPLFQHLNTMLGTAYAADHMKDWDITELIPPARRDEFWNTFGQEVRVHDALKPLPGAIEGMRFLAEHADVYVVTAYLRSAPTWVHDRDRWLSEHFGVSDKKIVHTHAKYVFSGAMLVDDKPQTVLRWQEENPNGLGVLWAQPYNAAYDRVGDATSPPVPGTRVDLRTDSWEFLVELVTRDKPRKIAPTLRSPFQLEAVSPGTWPAIHKVTLILGEGTISFADGELLVPYSRHEEHEALAARINAACAEFGLPPLVKLSGKPLEFILP